MDKSMHETCLPAVEFAQRMLCACLLWCQLQQPSKSGRLPRPVIHPLATFHYPWGACSPQRSAHGGRSDWVDALCTLLLLQSLPSSALWGIGWLLLQLLGARKAGALVLSNSIPIVGVYSLATAVSPLVNILQPSGHQCFIRGSSEPALYDSDCSLKHATALWQHFLCSLFSTFPVWILDVRVLTSCDQSQSCNQP